MAVASGVSTSPIYTSQPLCAFNFVSSGNVNTDGATGFYSSGIVFGANGALVDYVKAIPASGLPASGSINIFYNNAQSGFNGSSGFALWDTINYTSGATGAQYWMPGGNTLWQVAASGVVKFSCTVNAPWNVWLHYSCY